MEGYTLWNCGGWNMEEEEVVWNMLWLKDGTGGWNTVLGDSKK